MKFIPQVIPDIILIEPTLHGDDRGYFSETFRQDLFNKAIGRDINFIQDNESKSPQGVLRGLHYQVPPFSQSKLLRVIEGSVLDVVVDIRKSSPTFGQHLAIELSVDNKYQLFVPKGFAHGFLGLDNENIVLYSCSNYRSPKYEKIIKWNDKDLKIKWGIKKPILSKRDQNAQSFADFFKKK